MKLLRHPNDFENILHGVIVTGTNEEKKSKSGGDC